MPKFSSQDDADQRVGTRASPSPLDAAIVAKLGVHNANFFYEVKAAIADCNPLINYHEDKGSSSDEDDESEDVDGVGEGAVARPNEDIIAPVSPNGPSGPTISNSVHIPMELPELAGSKLEDVCDGDHPQLIEGFSPALDLKRKGN